LIAYVLGLSHALNIAFFTALAGSGEAAPRLAQLSSTTYDAQVDVATKWPAKVRNSISRSSISTTMGANLCKRCAQP
jgi:hypothetical protein